MKIWSVGVFTRVFLSAQTLKKTLHSSQIYHNTLIYNPINAWRVYATLHISSHLITPCHLLTKPKIVYFDVKTCEDLWRGKATLHVVNKLCHSYLYCICEEWRLFCSFLCFMGFQPYALRPASLCFSASRPIVYGLHPYGFQPPNNHINQSLHPRNALYSIRWGKWWLASMIFLYLWGNTLHEVEPLGILDDVQDGSAPDSSVSARAFSGNSQTWSVWFH